jgi:hypothetical protein
MRSYEPLIEVPKKEIERRHQPCLSLIISFEPKMGVKSQLQHKLKLAFQKAIHELEKNYRGENVISIQNRLHKIITGLDYTTYKKGIAIFVSPQFDKVIYLDVPVNEKIIIDDSFEIRDLVYNKQEMRKYLVLALSAKSTKIFLGNSVKLIEVISSIPEHMAAYKNDIPEKVGNFSNPSTRRETMLNKFLLHTDAGLSILLKAYPLPLFVLGDNGILGRFRQVSHNLQSVADYIDHDLIHASEAQLRDALGPYIADWNKVRQKDLLNKLERSAGSGRLASGITEVWRQSMQKKGMLLVVEKNFTVQAVKKDYGTPSLDAFNVNDASIMKDAVDDIIEKVLESGGDVEFVEDGLLQNYNRIALILYYQEIL